MLNNCNNDVWFNKHKHQVHQSDLFYIKRGDATEERLGGFIDEDNNFNIALIYKDHKFYNDDIIHHHICDFPLDEFRDYKSPKKKISTRAKNKLQIKELRQKVINLEASLKEKDDKIKQLRKELDSYESNEILKEKVIQLEKENKKLKYGCKHNHKK
jgi:hypothetical protein